MPALPVLRQRTSRFYGRGKLLLTGEYLVLDGARALAVPTRLGQELLVGLTDEPDVVHWVSAEPDGTAWFEHAYSRRGLRSGPPSVDKSPQARVARLLKRVLDEHPGLWPRGTGLRFRASVDFDRGWGLGSSATLAYTLAAWGGTDPYALNRSEFGGSGYDIACASAEGPLVYRLAQGTPRVEPLVWRPTFVDQLHLVYLGHKRDSRAGIKDYRSRAQASAEGDLQRFVEQVDDLTAEVHAAKTLPELADAMRRHEALVGYITHQKPIGRTLFRDYPGVAKSLGAWGGDFAMLIPEGMGVDTAAYCAQAGYDTHFSATRLLLLPELATPPAAEPTDWPVFLYGELAQPRVDNTWLDGHRYVLADLYGFRATGEGPLVQLVPSSEGSFVPGTVVYLPSEEVRALDMHPRGKGYVRTTVRVQLQAGGQEVFAQTWMARSSA